MRSEGILQDAFFSTGAVFCRVRTTDAVTTGNYTLAGGVFRVVSIRDQGACKMDVKRFLRIILLSAGLVLVLEACKPAEADYSEIMLENVADGTAVTLDVGQVLALKLESNPTTGYGWGAVEIDETLLEVTGDPEYIGAPPSSTPMVGAGGWEVLRFKALKSGTTTLKLDYFRSFEPDVAPLQEITLTITVR